MTEHIHHDDPKIERLLNTLIRAGRKSAQAGTIRPDNDSILAYLLDTATNTQREVIEAALVQSESFRLEILELKKQLAALSEYQRSSDRPKRDKVPELPDFLREMSKKESNSSSVSGAGKVMKLYIPLAAAAVLVFALVQTQMFGLFKDPSNSTDWSKSREVIHAGMLIANVTRSAEHVSSVATFTDEREAALDSFRRILKFKDGQFIKSSQSGSIYEYDGTLFENLNIRLIGPDGLTVENIQTVAPVSGSSEFMQSTVFVLSLPDRYLYRVELWQIGDELIWSETTGEALCITISYPVQNGFKAVEATYIEIPKSE